jgi:hypothetical protein
VGFRTAAAARHALYQLDRLAVLILVLEAHVDIAIKTGAGCLVVGGRDLR